MHRASYCNGQLNQQDAQIFTYNLYLLFLLCSTCFGRTIRPPSGASSSELYHAFGTFVQASLAATWMQEGLQSLTEGKLYNRESKYPKEPSSLNYIGASTPESDLGKRSFSSYCVRYEMFLKLCEACRNDAGTRWPQQDHFTVIKL